MVVSPIVRFDGTKWLKKSPRSCRFQGCSPKLRRAAARQLFKANAPQLPKDNKRPPKIIRNDLAAMRVDHGFLRLRHLGQSLRLRAWAVCEMGDAILGLVMRRMGTSRSRVGRGAQCVRPSDQGRRLARHKRSGSQIYKGFGRWSSVCSAIVCWAMTAAE